MPLIPLALIAFGLTLGQSLPIEEGEAPVVTSEQPESSAGRVVFDQRQTGRFNIHVSIKDVAIIEVGQNGLAEVSGVFTLGPKNQLARIGGLKITWDLSIRRRTTTRRITTTMTVR